MVKRCAAPAFASGATVRRRDAQSGFTLVGLLVVVAVINVAMAVAATSWVTLDKRAREAELIWRGQQIATAIDCFGREHATEALEKLEQLVEANCLRRLYPEPFARDGEWRVLRQQDLADGTIAALLGLPTAEGGSDDQETTAGGDGTAAPQSGSFRFELRMQARGLGGPASSGQGIVGVASNSTAEGLRVFRGRQHYSEWVFLASS